MELPIPALAAYDLGEAYRALEPYNLLLVVLGLAVLLTAFLPRLMHDKPLTLPMSFITLGFVAFWLADFEAPDPLEHGPVVEHLTELGVIVSLMTAGLTIDRRPGLRSWASTWRLLGITMPLTIAAAALLGWWVAGLLPASALLLGAVLAPTDPVMGMDVEVGAPQEGAEDAETEEYDRTGAGEEDEVRFGLSSEAGLNDGLAFPYTNAAIAMVVAGASPSRWIGTWLVVDVVLKLGVAVVLGLAIGKVLGIGLLRIPARTSLAKAVTGLAALAATLIVYGVTEFVGGYGFIATFIAAVTIRSQARAHEYHRHLAVFVEMAERIVMAVVLVALGGAIAHGLFSALTWQLVLVALLMVLVVRPAAGMVGLSGFRGAAWPDRAAMSFFGIRGIATFYYLAFALEEAEFPMAEELWAVAGLVVVISAFVHGLSGAPTMQLLDRRREARAVAGHDSPSPTLDA